MVRQLVKSVLAKAGIAIFNTRGRYYQDGLFTLHSDHFRADPAFRAAYARGVEASGGLDQGLEWRTHVALWAAQTALHVEGDFVECGVNAGFMSSAIMKKLQWNTLGRRFYLIDTFAGPALTQYSPEEMQTGRLAAARKLLQAGAYVTDISRVRANFAEWPTATVVPGTIPDILETIEFGQVAFLHLDLNCALPESQALEFFWARTKPGAIILLDDYAYYGHSCQREAMDTAARMKTTQVLSIPTGQGLIVR